MKINVKTQIDSIPFLSLTVPDNATVEDLKIAALIALPSRPSITSSSSINLWYSGIKLDYSKPLSSYKISPTYLDSNPNLSVYLTTIDDPIINQNLSDSAILDDDHDNIINSNDIILDEKIMKKSKSKSKSKSRTKSKSKKCSFLNCTSAPLRMVGDCQFCQGKFCSKHRLLESHNCSGLKTCKDKSYERNALKLQSEQTVASKV
jgi:hypothetical protein